MFVTTRIATRPTVDIPFNTTVNSPLTSTAFKDYFNTTYLTTGKVLSNTVTYSADLLTETSTVNWRDAAAQSEFAADPMIISGFFNQRTAHRANNGIIDITPK